MNAERFFEVKKEQEENKTSKRTKYSIEEDKLKNRKSEIINNANSILSKQKIRIKTEDISYYIDDKNLYEEGNRFNLLSSQAIEDIYEWKVTKATLEVLRNQLCASLYHFYKDNHPKKLSQKEIELQIDKDFEYAKLSMSMKKIEANIERTKEALSIFKNCFLLTRDKIRERYNAS